MSDDQAPGPPLPETSVPARAPARGEHRRTVFLALALLIAAGGGIGAVLALRWRHADPPPPPPPRNLPSDPRLLYNGPLRNIHPEVAYVGDDACTSCHLDEAEAYRRHPMGRSLQSIAEAADQDVYDSAHNNPFTALGARFHIERRGPHVWHQTTFADVPGQSPIRSELPVHYVIGSGTNGKSYLTSRNGFVMQTPISLFSQKQLWGLSPGFDAELLIGRIVEPACLHCHCNRANFHEGTLNRYDEPIFTGHAIGCERCHGPGGRHIDEVGKRDIVNPRRLPTRALRDAVCEQCHLEGEERVLRRGRSLYDYRPGLPLDDFWTVFVLAKGSGGERRAVTHVEQMHESRCYQGSTGKPGGREMICMSCHNPHEPVAPAQRTSYYRGKCMQCHDEIPCSLAESDRHKQQPDDSCIACHMPPFSIEGVAHTAATDHRIVRFKTPPREARLPSPPSGKLAPFHPGRSADDPELRRDLGIALVKALWKHHGRSELRGPDAVTLLDAALINDPEDIPAWLAKGQTLLLRNRNDQALAAFESVLRLAPEDESGLLGAAWVSQNSNRMEKALEYWRRAIAIDPEMAMHRMNFTRLLVFAKRWDEAREQCQAWVRLDPRSVEARKIWITCLLREGNRDAARAEFACIEALNPPNLGELRIWYAQQTR